MTGLEGERDEDKDGDDDVVEIDGVEEFNDTADADADDEEGG